MGMLLVFLGLSALGLIVCLVFLQLLGDHDDYSPL